MMNSLLKRQISKFLPDYLQHNEDLDVFLEAIGKSYNFYDQQSLMLQRATTISSEELSVASENLQKQTDAQKEIIEKLKNVIHTLKFYELEEDASLEGSNSLKLIDFINHQTKEIININKEKDKLLKYLKRQNQELNDYAHMVSHDLVTPLQNIETLAHLIEDDYRDEIDATGVQKLKLISENVHRVETLISAIRDYSSIKIVGKEDLEIDLHKIIDDTIQELSIDENIRIKIKDDLPKLKGEKNCFKHLFFNLIKNAIKFNDKDKKEIEIGYNEEEGFWKFYIKDNGNGIDEPYLKKVFLAFFKLENNTKSAGLGLSIVKKVTDLYEGNVWAESEVNEGSTFFFTIKK
ncbi:phospho-acceptor domain-containing protein [Tenacibaculum skagerrakense]|uniref:histidine kinase n=1 Tax=Tenacibaculum skagerrakense TaxID=186571 RepID=A0A4R2NPM5_9FLAO|nr:ATP-binding protein [Tenacibaculum skagerrakense]TCP23284.1 phospho-acceptor domain-containing protein [Tenacibaculum skagerrakense]